MQPNIPPKTAFINDVYAGNNRPFYPAIGQEGLPRDLMRSFLPATEYQTNISTLPLKPWMATKLALGSPCFTDKQSAFLKGNTFHNYFVSPEIMESGQFGASSTGATVYQASFSGNSGTPQTSVRAGKRDKENHRTQYDGSQSMIHNEVALLPPKPEDDDVLSKRWETQNDSTYKWSGWKETEDARSAHRPLGPLQILTSGSTQNQSFLDIAQNI
ncbi:uncharacterized protein LOC129585941 [Paramacrobiotus metropolitanus]|uniref:uncharacterized protein LOC129585941 n=1 Tax=Paramacrobiotus metropolitanus TaxID=2943436 RepID=UPI002445F6F1|nr:uncharacterized protein LOC129585941 [Paramacrobiotus metropolitanus]